MFDTFMNLPLHVLVLHFAVVLIPMSATATAAVFLYKPFRERFAGPAVLLNLGMLVLTFVTVQSGEALKDKLNPENNPKGAPSNDHEEYAQVLLWIVVALTIAAAIAWFSGRVDGMLPAAAMGLALVVGGLAIAAAAMTVVTGHTGSEAKWGYLYGEK
ncbi:MAG: DUF2231 domain-containing protein [Sporichthyaceae bacterium]